MLNFKSFLKKRKGFKWPSLKQWLLLFKVLNKKEKIALLSFLSLFLGSFLFLTINIYLQKTESGPAYGGQHTEGVVGTPRFINPIYAPSSDVDRDLVEIIFSGLMKYDDQGKIIPDLAKEINIKDDGKTYEVSLKNNVLWHDGEKLTADDIIFTFSTVQNPDYKSPLRANYLGVEIEKIDDLTVRFKLTTAYGGFLERLTLKIMPAHIWQNISPQNFLLTSYNLKPVGSGPYKFKKLKQDSFNTITSLELVRFANYFDSPQPYLAKIVFRFYQNEEELVAAAKRGEVDGFAISNPDYWKYFQARLSEYSLSLPRYFAVFFNPDKSRFLAKAEIRQALNYATDKEEIVASAILGQAEIIDSPLLPEIYGLEVPSTTYTFNPTKAEELITKTGLKKQDGQWVEINTTGVVEFKSDLKLGSTGQEVTALQTCLAKDSAVYPSGKVTGYFGSDTKAAVIKFQEKYAADILTPQGFDEGTGLVAKGTRTKLNEICFKDQKQTELSFTLITVKDPILEKVAELLKTQWESLGIGIEIKTYSISQLETEIIKPRNYEMLLFGEALTAIPDPYPFWHSSQKSDPGLNLAKYVNTKADKLLETARITMDEALRNQKYQDLQNIIIADAPALFLYSPDYIYFVSQKIKGLATELIVDPSKRFANIGAWHIKTHRSW